MGDRTFDHPKSSLAQKQFFPNKRLIVCCDGTWNAGDVGGQPLTNVAKIARCISDVDDWKPKGEDQSRARNFLQIVHYQPGVGTGTGWTANNLDALTGRGLAKGIRSAYSFICLNWSSAKDEIVLVGFSRGAFTVRCVAQFIQEVGLLTKSGLRHLPKLFEMWRHLIPGASNYAAGRADLDKRCEELKDWGELVRDVQIEACAVWDTVRAAFQPFGRKYGTVNEIIPKNIKFAVQALALGEKRNLFKPMEWKPPEQGSNQVLSQCWFAGGHSDVGGGAKCMDLANITLAWVIGQLTDKIHFNNDNLWAITTTRSWSKPSPSDDVDESIPEIAGLLKPCRVTAKAPISKSLLRSEDSFTTILTRAGGYGSRRPTPGISTIHYSVRIFGHLGITKYKKFAPESNPGETPTKPPLLSDAPPADYTEKISKGNKFEGEIIEKWAKHILCAHVNVKQARNSAETVSPEVLHHRLQAKLRPDASYEAQLPISAILSPFHKLAQDYQEGKQHRLNDILNHLKTEAQANQTWKNKLPLRKKPEATFRFEYLEDNPANSAASQDSVSEKSTELELSIDEESNLVFTRTFPLLMGRAHQLPGDEATSWVERIPVVKAFKKKSDDIRPCPKCAKIWES